MSTYLISLFLIFHSVTNSIAKVTKRTKVSKAVPLHAIVALEGEKI
jgi:hypothetical protein